MADGVGSRSARTRTSPGPRHAIFLGVVAFWLLFPFLQTGTLAEDAVPFIAVARVDSDQPRQYYSDDRRHPVPEQLREAGCPLTPPGTDCDAFVLPFLSAPPTIVVMRAVDGLGDTGTTLLFRLVGVAAVAGAMVLLWRAVTPGQPEAEVAMLVSAVLLTPMVYMVSVFGQNAPIMFLSACLGLRATQRTPRAIGSAAAWVGAVMLKAFPLPLILLAALHRRWKFLAWSAGLGVLLTLVTLPFLPGGISGQFLSSSRTLTASATTLPSNISIDALIHLGDPTWRGEGIAFGVVVAVRVALILGLFWWKLRDADEDLQWAYVWLALLAVHPQVWWHYFLLVIPPVALALRGRTGRWWWVLAAAAATTVPLAVLSANEPLVVLGPLVVVVAVVGIPFLAPAAAPSGRRARAAAPAR